MNNIIERGHFFSRKIMYGTSQNLHFVLTTDDDYKACHWNMLERCAKCVMLDTKRELLKIGCRKIRNISLVQTFRMYVYWATCPRTRWRIRNNHQTVLNIMYNLVMIGNLSEKYIVICICMSMNWHQNTICEESIIQIGICESIFHRQDMSKGLHTGTALDYYPLLWICTWNWTGVPSLWKKCTFTTRIAQWMTKLSL